MGLAEQIRAGAKLQRSIVALTTDSKGSGSVNLGASYALLAIQSSVPCRFRVYDTAASLENAGEASRSFGDLRISSSVALVSDFTMSLANTTYTIDPIMYGVAQNGTTELSYYRVDATTPPQIQITRYLLEDVSKPPTAGSSYAVSNRRSFDIKVGSLATNVSASGAFADGTTVPPTYLLVSASVSGTNNIVRLRLYSNSTPIYNQVEKTRAFENEPTASVPLIVDVFLSGSETTYFVPKIIGANLQNMGTDLIPLRLNRENVYGENKLYYVIENKGSVTTPVTASIHVYALED